jgi:hypothetical protein
MEVCKNSVAMQDHCQAVAATSQEAPHEARGQVANASNKTRAEEVTQALTPLSLTQNVEDALAALQLKMDQLVKGYHYLSENNQRAISTYCFYSRTFNCFINWA